MKSKKKRPKKIQMIAAILQTEDGKYLIHKRPNKGLLANLWEFPNVERKRTNQLPSKTILANFLLNEHQVASQINNGKLTAIKHIFTHLIWDIEVYTGKLINHVEEDETTKLVTKDELETYAFSVSHQKIWEAYIQAEN